MKKWWIAVLCAALCLILGAGAVNFLIDPLMQYRPLHPALTFVAFDYDYINPGLAKNSEYDGVLVGTSLAENTDMDKCETFFGEKMIKLIYPGGTSRNNREILDVAFRTHTLKTVIWVMDDTLYFNESGDLSHELPMYLYDDFLPNDVNYLLNLSVLYNYSFKDVFNSLRGLSTPALLRGDIWGHSDAFGKDVVLRGLRDSPQAEKRDVQYYQQHVRDNLEHNVLALLKAHPETEFYFCFPPKSIVYWYSAEHDGVIDAKFYSMEYVANVLLRQTNARVFFFADRMEWTTDLSLYKDSIHFKPEINDRMSQEMAQGSGELTAQTASETIRVLHDALKETDYSEYLN
ncbi:MAG: hypothetical protein IJT44_04815 [Clostridia bacterium]|nr:hypothetical protein [Clostridia bacterium]